MQNKPNCDSCGAPIFWRVAVANSKNPQPKPNPLDREPNEEKGNIILIGAEKYQVVKKEEIAKAKILKHTLYTSHFATCPDAPKFRRKK